MVPVAYAARNGTGEQVRFALGVVRVRCRREREYRIRKLVEGSMQCLRESVEP